MPEKKKPRKSPKSVGQVVRELCELLQDANKGGDLDDILDDVNGGCEKLENGDFDSEEDLSDALDSMDAQVEINDLKMRLSKLERYQDLLSDNLERIREEFSADLVECPQCGHKFNAEDQ
jgi:hypothetical protein